ncbi:MAG TPA: glycosyltransferase [Roseiflexaceae bacterium]|nr:glycosyltransferase [Roseiflexaceae bacterium]
MPRLLILHASVGTGHQRAAEALAEAFMRKQDGEVRVADALDYGSELFRRAYSRSYIDLSEGSPLLWRLFFESTDASAPELIEVTNRLRSLAERLGITRLERLVRTSAPEAIICTHFLPVELLLRLKRHGRLPQPLYCVVTDFFPHAFWVTPGIDGYFVGSAMTRDMLAARGVTPSIVRVSGIPIDPAIADPKELAEMRVQHGFPVDGSLVTLFGGGLNVQRVRSIVEGILASDICGTLAVVAGRSETLTNALEGLADGSSMRLRVLGFIDYVDDLVVASDIVISKAGGLIVSEVLARGTPMLLIDPIPGQEEWNADYVVSSGAGVQLRMVESVPDTVRQLLIHPNRLAALRDGAQETGRPRAALDIAEQVLHDLQVGVHG